MHNLRSIYNKAATAGLTTSCRPFVHVYTSIDKTAKRALIKREDGTEQQQYRNSCQAINRNLKKLSTYLQLSSPLTLYVARHSWASIAQSSHVPIHIISGALGNDSETTTQIYLASILTSQIDETNSMIINSL